MEENGLESVFPCVVANHDNPNSHNVKYYALLTNEILFKPLLYYPSSNTQNFHYGSARLNYLTYTSITDNIVQCPGKGNNVLGYKLTSPANKPYYEISIKANSLIYNMKNNFEANKITSINRYSNDYAYLLADTNKNIACFSIIFSDEKNSIIEDSDLKIVLFDTRDYNATFAGSKKYIQIIYKKNDYFNLTLFLLNENVEIKFRYYDFKKKQYFYSFEKTSDELQVQFHFEKVKEFSSNMNYYQIEMSYKGLDEDIIIETIDKDTFKCLNEYTIFNIKYNSDKSYIYLLTNDTNNVYLNEVQLRSASSKNNFYSLNKNSRLDIYASSNNIICFELMLETNNGVFEFDRIQKKDFNIMTSNDFYFNLVSLIPNMKYYIEVKSENNNIRFNNYQIGERSYSFTNLITFEATSEETNFKLSLYLSNSKMLDILHISFYYIETIDKDIYECLDKTHYYDVKYNSLKNYIYILTNDKSNVFLDNQQIEDVSNYNNFYYMDSNKRLNIIPSGNNKICYELKYESKNGSFILDNKIQTKQFHLFSGNYFVFSLINLLTNATYYFDIQSKDINLDYYILGEERHDFSELLIDFTPTSNEIKLEFPVTLTDNNIMGNINISYYYKEKIENNIFKNLNENKFYIIKYFPQKPYIYLLTNDTTNTYLNNKKLPDITSTYNSYEIKEDAELRIYPEENSIINFELIYQINKGEFELKPGQTLNFNIMANNTFVFNIIDLTKNVYYYIDIENTNKNIDYYTLNNKQYDYMNLIPINGLLVDNKIEFPVVLKDKNNLGNLIISLNILEIIENDIYKCFNTSIVYIIKYTNKNHIYIY